VEAERSLVRSCMPSSVAESELFIFKAVVQRLMLRTTKTAPEVEELYGTRYQSGSFPLINVGSGFYCLRSSFFLNSTTPTHAQTHANTHTHTHTHTHAHTCIHQQVQAPFFLRGTLDRADGGNPAHTWAPLSHPNADLTEGLFDETDGLSGPHGSFCSQSRGREVCASVIVQETDEPFHKVFCC
jgi:hypothetical protein